MAEVDSCSNTGASRGESEKHQIVLNNVYKLLECPECNNIMSSPIYQCPNGHTICSICKFQVQSLCPICCVDMGSIRCLALEKVAEPLNIPYDCPYPGSKCLVREGISALVEHLKDDHDVGIYDTYKFNHRRVQLYSNEMEKASGISVAVFNCYGVQFCYHLEDFLVGMTPCYIAFLRFMGEDIEAKRFNYVLRLVGDDRVLQWQGVPRSLRDTYDQVRDDLDGLVIPRNLAFLFSNGNGKELALEIYGRIWIEH
ncbi:hypothetical protein CTI12_AA058750 [Artemisia annua]|uniref:Uncharacterized protein n=1 Tax=Artemisia annua TaxID=35608 RepID=A0A2U1Q3D1_ARTAN|nr:hypothetical protein CTI12_AA058750 [Artemisia annua]